MMAVKTDEERGQVWTEQRDRFAEPDGTIVEHGGLEYARIRGKVCPQCDGKFFTYQRVDEIHRPYQIDPEPDPNPSNRVVGARETCGWPGCLEAEQAHQFKRTQKWLADQKPADDTQEAPKPKLVKKVQRLQPLAEVAP